MLDRLNFDIAYRMRPPLCSTLKHQPAQATAYDYNISASITKHSMSRYVCYRILNQNIKTTDPLIVTAP